MNNITVYLEVYNEEKRLKECLSNFIWAQELVVFVKKSTDNTLNIARKYATHVYEVDYCDGNQNLLSNFRLHSGKKWIFFCTASSRIDQELVKEILNVTNDINFDYDAIGIPYQMSVLGIQGKASPWGANYKYAIINKSNLILSERLHQEIRWKGNNVYTINRNKTQGRFYHITHEDPKSMFCKHLRYVEQESHQYFAAYGDKAFSVALYEFIKSIGFIFIKKRSIYYGRDGLVLSLAYISYFLMRLVYIWFYQRKF